MPQRSAATENRRWVLSEEIRPDFGSKVSMQPEYNCCGKPQGCTNINPECAFLQHPYKKWVREQLAKKEADAS